MRPFEPRSKYLNTPPPERTQEADVTQRHSVLVIGCGNIAGGFDEQRAQELPPVTHAGGFSRHPRCFVRACVEPDEGRRLAFSNRWGVPLCFASVSEAVAHGPFDIVSICSPTALHPEHLAAALSCSPRLVFCEKPLAPTLGQAQSMVQACQAAGVRLAVNHSRRWAPDVRRIAHDLRAGRWGCVRSVVGIYNKGILNNGSHLIDLLHMLVGPMRLLCAGAPVHDHFSDDPSVPAMLISDDSVPVHLSISHAHDCSWFELQIVTERGLVAMEDGGLSWRMRGIEVSQDFKGYRTLGGDERLPGQYLQCIANAVDDLVDSLETGREPACSGDIALQAQALCEHILQHAITSTGTTS